MWERRYGILQPQRTDGGFRLYSPADEQRVMRMRQAIAEGLPASLAARRAVSPSTIEIAGPALASAVIVDQLAGALDDFDEATANAILDRALATLSLDALLTDVMLPYLQDLGMRWERNEVSIAQEHFATNIVRGRLLGLARGWGTGAGPRALLACPPGELHDLALICFGLILRDHGWRVVLLGPNTPISTLREAAAMLDPTLVVVSSMSTAALEGVSADLAPLGATRRLAIAGPGATAELATETTALHLVGSPTAAAKWVATHIAKPATS
jgi:methanogenic corrinoid protein MtbC1